MGYGTAAVAKLLIERGADVNALNIVGSTPLILAVVEGGREDMVRILLQAGADWTIENNPPSGLRATAREWAAFTTYGQPRHPRIVAMIDEAERAAKARKGGGQQKDEV